MKECSGNGICSMVEKRCNAYEYMRAHVNFINFNTFLFCSVCGPHC